MLDLLGSMGLNDEQIWMSPFRLFDPHGSIPPVAASKRAAELARFCLKIEATLHPRDCASDT